jgi:hypothetical protein
MYAGNFILVIATSLLLCFMGLQPSQQLGFVALFGQPPALTLLLEFFLVTSFRGDRISSIADTKVVIRSSSAGIVK